MNKHTGGTPGCIRVSRSEPAHACTCVCVSVCTCIRTDFSRSDCRGRSFHFNSRLAANMRPITSRIARSGEEASEVVIRRPKRCVCACRIARRDATRRDAQSLHYSTEKDYALVSIVFLSFRRADACYQFFSSRQLCYFPRIRLITRSGGR